MIYVVIAIPPVLVLVYMLGYYNGAQMAKKLGLKALDNLANHMKSSRQ